MSLTLPVARREQPPRIDFDPVTARCAGVGRAYVKELLSDRDQSTIDNAAIIASELLGNAALHGRRAATLTLDDTPDGLTIEVTDHGRQHGPRLQRPAGEGGYGLTIVEALTASLRTRRRRLTRRYTVRAVMAGSTR